MAYDEDLANRVRELLGERADYTEIAMFGGLAFMVNTHMACGAMGSDLLVRVGKAGYEAAIGRGAREFDFTGRPMRSMVVVPADLVADDTTLRSWVDTAVEFAQSEPPKPPKATTSGKRSRAGRSRSR
jgi:TfoX/Sxy family transcriptional regulator of competence genes